MLSKYDGEPGLMDSMRAALSGLRRAGHRRGTEDPLTEVIVEKIVKLAKSGGRDPTRMGINVLAALESPSSPAPAASIRGH
jgi:hypothetical protein